MTEKGQTWNNMKKSYNRRQPKAERECEMENEKGQGKQSGVQRKY